MRNPNLRQELTRQPELFKRGYITQVDYEQAFLFIDRLLQCQQLLAEPEARQITPLHEDFEALWQQMILTERRAILQAIFVWLYFDAQNHLRKVATHDPFNRVLNLTQTVCENIAPEIIENGS